MPATWSRARSAREAWVLSLLRRIEQAQQRADIPTAGAIACVPPSAAPMYPTYVQGGSRDDYLKNIRRRLVDQVIGASHSLLAVDESDLQSNLEALIDQVIAARGFAITHVERLRLIEDVVAEITGFGPIEPLLRDGTVTEVMVNGPRQVYIERKGKLELTNVVFRNDEHVMHIIDRIIAPLGRRIDESSPKVDARLPDGSRVNAIIAPLSLIGPVITVRKFSTKPFTVDDLVGFGTATAEMFDFLRVCVEARLNIFVSGGTGSGKTTFLNVLSSFIPNEEQIVTIEDAAELQLRQEHVVTLEARSANVEGEGEGEGESEFAGSDALALGPEDETGEGVGRLGVGVEPQPASRAQAARTLSPRSHFVSCVFAGYLDG
jgi:pilus assembly protein CpaF